MHYARWLRHGDPEHLELRSVKNGLTARDKVLGGITVVQRGEWECWEWPLTKGERYAQFKHGGRLHLAHRFSYEVFVGSIPEGLTIDHLCRNTACVRPEHLEPVTMRVNVLRGDSFASHNKRKTHCDSGHEFTLENTRINGDGSRGCRECGRIRKRRGRARLHPPRAPEGMGEATTAVPSGTQYP